MLKLHAYIHTTNKYISLGKYVKSIVKAYTYIPADNTLSASEEIE